MHPYPPDDFEDFWLGAVEPAMQAKLNYHRSLSNDFDLPGFRVERIDFSGIGGEQLSGWIAYPPGARRLPSFVWVPPYGRESLLPNAYGTREGFASLSLNFFGHDAFHQEKYTPSRGYFGEGAGDPVHWIFRTMFQNAVIATRVLQAQPEADEDRIAAMGMSQGAGISIWLGAWCPIIRAVCADMPFLANIRVALERNVYRYPLKELVDAMESLPLGRERISHMLAYFDTMNQATRCAVPTLLSRGLKDPSVRPETVQAVFEALPGVKQMQTYDWGHDWHPDMIETNRKWLLRYLV